MTRIRYFLVLTLLITVIPINARAVEDGKVASYTSQVLKVSVQYNELATGILKQNNCSGTLTTPNVVATDAHCLFISEISEVQKDISKVLVGWANQSSLKGEPVKEIDVNPSYIFSGSSVAANDIAYLVLSSSRDFDSNIRIASESEAQKLINSSAEATAYGYGFTSDKASVMPEFPYTFIGNLSWPISNMAQFSADVRSKVGHACGGDSGGPIIIYSNGTPFLLGLISGVNYRRENCGGTSSSGEYVTQLILLNQIDDFQKKVLERASTYSSSQQPQAQQPTVPSKKAGSATCVRGVRKAPQKLGKCPKGYILKS